LRNIDNEVAPVMVVEIRHHGTEKEIAALESPRAEWRGSRG